MSPRIVYLVTEDWYFLSHRLPMARAAQKAGFDVHVATRVDRHRNAIESQGFQLHPLSWKRGSFDPRRLIGIVNEVRNVYRRIEPDIAHHVSLQASLVGSLATLGLPLTCVNAVTGLGTSVTGSGPKLSLARAIVKIAGPPLLNRRRSAVLVQNPDDRAALERLGIDRSRIALIPGSGVNICALTPALEPEGAISVAFVGRLIEAKGVRVLVTAYDILQKRRHDIRLLIAGTPDPSNPSSITEKEIDSWRSRPNLTYLGFVEDISALWNKANIAVQPSLGGEGLPLSLLEAAACGRALIATDVPGNREIARQSINAEVVPANDAEALANAIERLADNPQLRRDYGMASRQLVEQEFSDERIGRDIVALYRRLLNRLVARPFGGSLSRNSTCVWSLGASRTL